jgi:hypothetical protein
MTEVVKKKIELECMLKPENHVTITLQEASNHNIDHNELNNLFKQLTSASQITHYKMYVKAKKEPKPAIKKISLLLVIPSKAIL